MFKLNRQDCKLVSVNPRAELHGEDSKAACDLKFTMTMSNTVLDLFSPELRPGFYKPIPEDEKDLADQGADDKHLGALRFPNMPSASWGYVGAGYRSIIALGFDSEDDLILINTKIDKFKFGFKHGGSVDIEFRIISHPNEKDFGRLCTLIGESVDLTLEPPCAEDLAQMELDAINEDDED